MITEGGSRSEVDYFGWELDDTVANEKNELIYCEGVTPGTAAEMLRDLQAMAVGFTGKNWFAHFSQNNKGDRNLTDDEELEAVRMNLRKQGLEGQPFFVKRHTHPDGSRHTHTIVLRVKDGKAVNDDFHDLSKCKEVSRDIEEKFNLRRMDEVTERTPNQQRRAKWQIMKAGDNGISLDEMDQRLASLKNECKDGKEFAARLAEIQLILARGDKVAFMTVDQVGSSHKLRVQLNLKQAELMQYMSLVDQSALPTLREARAMQAAAIKAEYSNIIKQVWKDSKNASTVVLLKTIADQGYVIAKGKKRGVFLCVGQSGKYVSLQDAAKVGKTAFDLRMATVDWKALPDVKLVRSVQAAKKSKSQSSARPISQKTSSSATALPSAPQDLVQQQDHVFTPQPVQNIATLGLSQVINSALIVTGQAPESSHPIQPQQSIDLSHASDKKKRAVATVIKAARPSVASRIEYYARRIAIATIEAPDYIPELERERDAAIAALVQEIEAENELNENAIESANFINQRINEEEQADAKRATAENNEKIKNARKPQVKPIKPGGFSG